MIQLPPLDLVRVRQGSSIATADAIQALLTTILQLQEQVERQRPEQRLWTPIDRSVLNMTLTYGHECWYWRMGEWVMFTADVIWPSSGFITVNASISAPMAGRSEVAGGAAVSYQDAGLPWISAAVQGQQGQIDFFDADGVSLTNVDLSEKRVILAGLYPL
jgi:hypothetical protein